MKEGIILINKAKGTKSFDLVKMVRRISGIQKVGHAGTLDPLATGVMILLVGREYTRQSDKFLNLDKEYLATIKLGYTTETFDAEKPEIFCSDKKPTLREIEKVIETSFSGMIEQIPPMYSAKKVDGQKLYHLARQNKTIRRLPTKINVTCNIVFYTYPLLELKIICSKGTYIRSLANDIGQCLGCGGYLQDLCRTRVGKFKLEDCSEEKYFY